MEFEIELDYTIQDFDAYWRGFLWKKPERRAAKEASPRTLRFGGWFFIIGGMISLFAWPMFRHLELSMGGLEGVMLMMMRTPLAGIAELIVGGSLLYQGRRPEENAYSHWVQKNWKRWQKDRQHRTCRFTEEEFQARDEKSRYHWAYTELDKLWEDEGRFYVTLRDRSVCILPKAKFTAGNPADLPAFWRERTGKPVEQVK